MTTVAVLGMHRSGTSWLAGSLQTMGLELGEVNEAAEFNAKGNRENERIQELHAAVMRDSGGSWRRPPERVVWSASRRAELEALVAEFDARAPVWGFKDPRALFLLDEWQAVVGDLRLIGVYRHPARVAASLARRGDHAADGRDAVRLWCAYNEQLVRRHRQAPFPILCFDRPDTELLAALGEIAPILGLADPRSPGEFFDASLIHHAPHRSEPIPWRARRLWRYLEDHVHHVTSA